MKIKIIHLILSFSNKNFPDQWTEEAKISIQKSSIYENYKIVSKQIQTEPEHKLYRDTIKDSKASVFFGNILNKTMIFTKFVGLKISNKK